MAFDLFPVDVLNKIGALLMFASMAAIIVGINILEDEKHRDS